MLDLQDKKDIKEILKEAFDGFSREIFNPAFQGMQDQLNNVQKDVIGIKGEMGGMQGQINGLKNTVEREFADRPTIHHMNTRFDALEKLITNTAVMTAATAIDDYKNHP